MTCCILTLPFLEPTERCPGVIQRCQGSGWLCCARAGSVMPVGRSGQGTFPEHSWSIPRAFPDHPRSIPGAFPERSWRVPGAFPEHSQSVPGAFPEHSRSVLAASLVRSRSVPGASPDGSRSTPGAFPERSRPRTAPGPAAAAQRVPGSAMRSLFAAAAAGAARVKSPPDAPG